MKKRIFLKILEALCVVAVLGSVAASFYFFDVAQVRGEKSFVSSDETPADSPLYAYQEAFDKLPKEERQMTHQNLKQVAWYVPAAQKTDKTVIVVHGFGQTKARMRPYAYLFHKLGYNVLMPDNIAHGESDGQLIGYGWNDRLNVIRWAELLVEENPTSELVLYGLSMGGATVMMASGESNLPEQVTAIIEDAGYTSVWDELVFQAKDMYNLPAFPLLYQVSALSKLRAGFTYGEASAVKQLQKNTLPILFIHGDNDNFVPTHMVYDNYEATAGDKELYIVKGADHSETFQTDVAAYEARIEAFLKSVN
ncbi:alpha/beta hydrolase [Streptococcus sp. E17BB]|uniref:alpha/beta hydrolase n=1 Tax=Streptococcus sp. E17BB TaxID=3278714 RepID=UPI00359CBB92